MANLNIIQDWFTSKEVNNIMRIDAVKVSSDTGKYCKRNFRKYVVLLNTWFYMCSQYVTQRGMYTLKELILRDGLINAINMCANLASEIIRSDFTLSDLGQLYFIMTDDPKVTLQLLRYPKRFSPIGADKLAEEAIKTFLYVNSRSKGVPSVIDAYNGQVLKRFVPYPAAVVGEVRRIVHRMLSFWDLDPTNDPITYGKFSNGATAEGCKTKFEKYREFCRTHANFKGILYPLPRYGGTTDTNMPLDFVKVVAVPKSYKTPRIIAEVSAVTQFGMQGIRYCAERSVEIFFKRNYGERLIAFDDQSLNQEKSWLGSVNHKLCTIDLSAASDSISDSLAEQVLPPEWYRVIREWNPEFIQVNGKKVKRYIFLTSGSGDTFCLESIIFWAIAEAATTYAALFCDTELEHPQVFGDDIICDSNAYDTIVDYLTKLGFTVNLEKSYSGEHNYRESCGAEWWCGLDTATKYFPRKAFEEDSPEFLEGLISLQHRIFSYPDAEMWLTNYIRSFATTFIKEGDRMTGSPVGSEDTDLWEEYPSFKVMNPPVKKGTEPPAGNRRERHYSLLSKPWSEKAFNKAFLDYYGRPRVPLDDEVCEMIRYVEFLQRGVEVDEYGIPIHTPSIEDDLLNREVVWAPVIR